MIAKTEAIPIRIATYGGTSHIVTWLTPEYGKISTAIKGAQRPKRIGGGQYDLGYLCELLFYERESNGLHTFKDCVALESRLSLRGKWQETALLSYFCLLAGNGTFPFVKNSALYQKLLLALQALDHPPFIHLMLWFELQLLALHGTAPQLKHCTICHCSPTTIPLLSSKAGGVVCPPCNTKRNLEAYCVTPDTLHFLQVLQRLRKPLPLTSAKRHQHMSDQSIVAIGHFIGRWMDISLRARNIAVQMATLQFKKK